MLYFLMYKNDIVGTVSFTQNGFLEKESIQVLNEKLLPIGGNSKTKLVEWWNDRAIPSTRGYIISLLKSNIITSSHQLLLKNFGLSLTDCYWVKPVYSDNIEWENINLYSNSFLDTNSLVKVTNNNYYLQNKLVPASSQGELEKIWVIDEVGNRILVKGNYSSKIQQSLNEVFSTKLLDLLGYSNYVSYYLIDIISDMSPSIGCACKSFTNANIEAISFWDLLKHYNKTKSSNLYIDCIEICENLGLDRYYVEDFLNREIAFDYLISNTDRHMKNISVLRNTNTLQFISMAPMYDFGNSMFFRCNEALSIPIGKRLSKLETHSFNTLESHLLQHVNKDIKLDLGKIVDRSLFDSIYSLDTTKSQEFYDKLYVIYLKKVDMLKSYLDI